MTRINAILAISLICQLFLQVQTNQQLSTRKDNINNNNKNKQSNHNKRKPEALSITTSFDLTMQRASLRDFLNFLSDIISGILEPNVSQAKGKAYGFSWTSSHTDQEISLNLEILDQFATLIRSIGPKHKFPVNSQVLKDSRHTQRPVLQTIIDFIEEQTNHHYSREIGQFMVKQAAKFTGLYLSSSAHIVSSVLMTISSMLESKD